MVSTQAGVSQSTATLHVANLPNETSEADIRTLFSPYGAVQRVRLFPGEFNRRCQGFGYVDLNPDEVESSVAGLDGQVFKGSIIRVSDVSGEALVQPVQEKPTETVAPRMDNETPTTLMRRRYEVASVDKTEAPEGGEGGEWYRYELACGRARISGLRRGTLEEVTAFATSCAEDFNLRSATGKGTRAMAAAKKK